MQAFAPSQPMAAAKAAILKPAQTASVQDQFQAVLQGRLVAHLQREAFGALASKASKAATVAGGAGGAAQGAGGGVAKGQPQTLARRLPPERLPEVAAVLLLAGFPAERLQALLADPRVQQQGLSLGELRQAWLETSSGGSAPTREQVPGRQTVEPLPPVLAALLDLVSQSPEGVLPVSPSRRPEIAALLQEAGFSPKQVETLLTSPRVQEHGLTVDLLQSAWLKAPGQQTGQAENPAPGADLKVTSRADYQRLWDRLRLPAEALSDLRLALQQLGATPEALAALEEHATPQGLPVGQVWQVIKQCAVAGQAADSASTPTVETGAPPSGPEVEQWRQLLLQAGFSAEAVEGVLGVKAPASAAELLKRLASLAPSDSAPKRDNNPKPLYLPENLRLRSLPQESRPEFQAGWGEQQSGRETSADQHELPAPPTLASDNSGALSSFLAPSAAPVAASGPSLGGNTLMLSPEIRRAFWSQLEAGILGNLQPGATRLDLSLDPPQLGHIELTLNLKGDDLAITAVMSRSEAAHLAGAGMEQLAQALSQQGLILSQFQVSLKERGGDPQLLATQVGKIMEKRTPPPGGQDSRRRGTGKVDRFA